jgi:hypothetical protein
VSYLKVRLSDMRTNPYSLARSVVHRYVIANIPVPPRRGTQGKFVFLQALLTKLEKHLPLFAYATKDLKSLREWQDMFQASNISLPDLEDLSHRVVSTLKDLQGYTSELDKTRNELSRHYAVWHKASESILNHPLQDEILDTLVNLVRQRRSPPKADLLLSERLESLNFLRSIEPEGLGRSELESLRDLFVSYNDKDLADYFQDLWQEYDRPNARRELLGLWYDEIGLAFQRSEVAGKTQGPAWNFDSMDPLAQSVVTTFVDRALTLRQIFNTAKDRLEIERQNPDQSIRHPSITRYETLYHASVVARKLYQQGFDNEVPEQAGLGGSQGTQQGKGTSFTYDLYVAKEVSRSLKELVMISKGVLKAREIYDWAKRDGVLDALVNIKDTLLDVSYDFVYRKGEWRIINRITGEPVSPNKAFDTPVKTARLYKQYLLVMGQAGKRYDPLIMHVDRVVPVLSRVNPKDIGIVVVTVDMSHPDILHIGHERELRVPSEAIVSVDQFITG